MQECVSKFAKKSENAFADTSFLLAQGRKTRVAFGSFSCPRQTLFRVVDPGTIVGRLSGRLSDSADGLQVGERV